MRAYSATESPTLAAASAAAPAKVALGPPLLPGTYLANAQPDPANIAALLQALLRLKLAAEAGMRVEGW